VSEAQLTKSLRLIQKKLLEKQLTMEDSVRRARGTKRLFVNQRVSGAVGDYIDGPTKRRRRQRLFGTIIGAAGEKSTLLGSIMAQRKSVLLHSSV
jgi:hypothetical protein